MISFLNSKHSIRICGLCIWVFVTLIYMFSAETSVDFWESGHTIVAAYGLQIPNAATPPLYILIARLFSLFSFGNVAYSITLVSVFAASLTVVCLYSTVIFIAHSVIQRITSIEQLHKTILVILSGSIASLSLAFSHTFWNIATQSSPHAFTLCIVVCILWAMFRWEQSQNNRWILLIAFAIGILATGNSLYLLILPACAVLYYCKKYTFTRIGIIIVIFVSFVITALIIGYIIPGISYMLFLSELLFVNKFSLPQHFGVFIICFVVLALIIIGLYYSHIRAKYLLNTAILSFLLFCIAYSSLTVFVIRSQANPPIDYKNPEHAYSLFRYITDSQHTNKPLWFGQSYASPVVEVQESTPLYTFKQNRYVTNNCIHKPIYARETQTLFPRVWSSQSLHVQEYVKWAQIEPEKNTNAYYINGITYHVPTFLHHLKFFITYQCNYMYVRYLMWNFVGQQNDIIGNGEPHKGNWISGIPFFDSLRLGPQDSLPDVLQNNKARNTYFFIPFLLAIAGFILVIMYHKRYAIVITLVFVCGGGLLAWYFNYTPLQARERDYEFVLSFYAFSMCIGLGVVSLYVLLYQYFSKHILYISIAISGLCPVLLYAQNYDDCNKSGRLFAHDFSKNLLTTCKPNSLLFSDSDNDTYPLWYIQQVEKYRTDVRGISVSLLSTDWYISSLRQQNYASNPVLLGLSDSSYRLGTNEHVFVLTHSPLSHLFYPIQDIIRILASPNQEYKAKLPNGKYVDYIPVPNIVLPVNITHALESGVLSATDTSRAVQGIPFTPLQLNSDGSIRDTVITKSTLAMLDILAHMSWVRPLYFSSSVNSDQLLHLHNYLYSHGLAHLLTPIEFSGTQEFETQLQLDAIYSNLMHEYTWEAFEQKNVYIDDYIRLQVMQYRNMFAQAAQACIQSNQKEKAIELLQKCMQLFPNSEFPYDFTMIDIAKAYQQIGEKDVSQLIVNEVIMRIENNVLYYRTAPKKFQKSLNSDIEQDIGVLIQLFEYAIEIGDERLAQKNARIATMFIEEYYSFTRQISVCLPQEFQSANMWVYQLQGNLPYIAYWYNSMKYFMMQNQIQNF